MAKHLEIALKEIGVEEIPGKKHEKRILEYWTAVDYKATDDETAWCSAFLNWVMMKAGYKRTRRANAKSWLNWGVTLLQPIVGAVVIYDRGGWKGHVGIVSRITKDGYWVVGGNQKNMVCEVYHPDGNSRLIGIRYPEELCEH